MGMIEKTNGTTKYLKINGKGELYESAKTATEGFTRVEMNIAGKDRVFYHKLYKAFSGKVTYMGIRDCEYDGRKWKEFRLGMQDEDQKVSISMPLKTQKGNLTDYLKSFACVMETLVENPDMEVTFSPYAKKQVNEKTGKEYTKQGIYISDNSKDRDNNLINFRHKFGTDIPNMEKKESMGDVTYDYTKQDEYLFNIIEESCNKAKDVYKSSTADTASENSNNESNSPSSSKAKTSSVSVDSSDEDDLPF